MTDATSRQLIQLGNLIEAESDPHGVYQGIFGNWGIIKRIARGEVDPSTLTELKKEVNQWASEKVRPALVYPKGYKPTALADQVARLAAYLPGLDTQFVTAIAGSWEHYDNADGLYVIPKPTVLAAKLGIADPWENFGTLTEKGPMAALESQRPFTFWRKGEMGPEKYQVAKAAKDALMELERRQMGDFLVFPAQTGKLYGGFSPRNSQWEIKHATSPWQWPLPTYVGGWILYANPHRLGKFEDLCIDFPGDEYRLAADGTFGEALCFDWYDGKLRCHYRSVAYPHEDFGSASGFGW